MNKQLPIGIFDSGMGGLTVLEAIYHQFDRENLIFFGDNYNIPYGSKDIDEVKKLSVENFNFLMNKHIKLLIIACNTVSSIYFDEFESILNVPVLRVIKPCALKACELTKTGNIAVIGTENTIEKKFYEDIIESKGHYAWAKSTPLLAPMIEYGVKNKKIIELMLEEYFEDMPNEVDVLALGCTHYPFIKKIIKKVIPNNIQIVDSNESLMSDLYSLLDREQLFNDSDQRGAMNIYLSKKTKAMFSKINDMFHDTDFNVEVIR